MLTENKYIVEKKINLQNEIAFSMPREINVDVTGKAHTQNTIKDQIAKDTLGVIAFCEEYWTRRPTFINSCF